MHSFTPMGTRQWFLTAVGVVMVGAAGTIVLRSRGTEAAPPPLPISSPLPSASVSPSLTVKHEGSALHVQWDPNVTADRGMLIITDGPRESRLDLDPRDLRSGYITYWPETQNVAFRLELDGAPAGELRTAAAPLAPRPSAFRAPQKPQHKAVPVRRIAPPQHLVEDPPRLVEDPPKRPSRLSRTVSKIPLLRRLRKHRD